MVKTLSFNAGGVSSIPGQGARIPQAEKTPRHKTEKQYCTKFNEHLKIDHNEKNLKKENQKLSARVHFFRRKKADRPRAKPNSRNRILILWEEIVSSESFFNSVMDLYKATSQQVFRNSEG